MVILGKKFGRLANRLWVFTNFAANAIEYKYPLVYRNFDEFIDYFDATATNDFQGHDIICRLSENSFIDKLLHWKLYLAYKYYYRFIKKGSGFTLFETSIQDSGYDLNNKEYLDLALGEKNVIIGRGGFWFMDDQNTIKHKDTLKDIFKPVAKYYEEVESFIAKCKTKGNCLVGVHLRKQDYRKFNKGEHFYEDEVYVQYMRRINDLLSKEGKNPVFVVCSDEPIDENNFKPLTIVKGPNHFITDLYSFSKCDYIFGPPSSYTMWASFYGDVPLKFILGKDVNFTLKDFEIVRHMGDGFRIQSGKKQSS